MAASRMVVAGLIVLATSVYAADDSKKADPALQQRLNALASKIETGEIRRVVVMTIPESLITDEPISPDDLERAPFYTLTVHSMSRQRDSLAKAIRSVVPRRSETYWGGDFRWAIVFYGAKDTRVEAVYFTKLGGGRGLLGSTRANLDGNLLPWMKQCFGPQVR